MSSVIKFEVFPNDKNRDSMRKTLKKHGFETKENQYGEYYYIEVSKRDSWMMTRLLDKKGYKYRSFDKRYERATNYRGQFLKENNRRRYRCAYCGKRIKKENMEVDHLIPVAKAKTSWFVRFWLQICGIRNVNDTRNLVAACMPCNRRKSDSMGVWVIKGSIGRFRLFWIIRDVILTIIVCLLIWCATKYLPLLEGFFT